MTPRLGGLILGTFALGWVVGRAWSGAPHVSPLTEEASRLLGASQAAELPCDCVRERREAMGQAFESCELQVYLAGTAEAFPEATPAEREQAQAWLDGLVAECPELLHDAKKQLLCDEMPCMALLEQDQARWADDVDLPYRCSPLNTAFLDQSEHSHRWLVPLMPTDWLADDQNERWHRRWRSRKHLVSAEP
jgi:hypothetical protein